MILFPKYHSGDRHELSGYNTRCSRGQGLYAGKNRAGAEQIAAANNDEKYSSGDDDVLVFELVIEQLRNDIGEGN